MSHAIYTASAESFIASLTSLSGILTKAAAHENAASLPGARLAPDMFPLSTQVQLTCFAATNGTARLMGHEPAARPDIQEQDLAGLQKAIAETLAKLGRLSAADFAGAEERRIVMPMRPPHVMDIGGLNFLHRWLLPNFYFHAVTSYDILRHNGVAIGKQDYLAHISGFMRQSA